MESIGKFFTSLSESPINYGTLIAIVGALIILYVLGTADIPQAQVITLLFVLSPLWLPYLLFFVFFDKWMEMVGLQFYVDNGRTTLEIRLPPEVFKSPEAMETVFTQIHNAASPDNLWQTYIDGKRPLPYSFELVSTGGEVKFYVNVPTKKTKELFKVELYSQYPGVEIVEVPLDYTAEIPNSLEGYESMTVHMQKKKDQAYPIKLYSEFGLDKMPKEEEKNDPMTPMLEALGSIKPHERVWIQIIITPHREKSFKLGQLQSAPTWETDARKVIDKLMSRDSKTKVGPTDLEGMPRITPGERAVVEVIEKNLEKYAYETGIRWMYITQKGKFDGDKIGMFIRSFSQYDVQGRNGVGVGWRTDFDYNWFSDPFNKRRPAMKREELKYYKLRIYAPKAGSGRDKPKIFTAAELATMWHLPGKVALTPTLQRVPSTRSEAPSNLPIG